MNNMGAAPVLPLSANRPTLDIVIVDYNAGLLVRRCLETIVVNPPRQIALVRLVIVDNASQEPTSTYLSDLSLPLVLIRNDHNKGFAAACNQGAWESRADYLLFLNPDTTVTPGSLDIPVSFLERPENSSVGLVGVQLLTSEGTVARSCSRFPEFRHYFNKASGLNYLSPKWFPLEKMVEWDHGDCRAVDVVMGAFLLVRRTLFESLHGFDERFFIYFEEGDFCLRVKQAGFSTFFLATAQIFHQGCGTTERVIARRLFYSLRSRIIYGWKHFSLPAAAGLLVISSFFELFARIAQGAYRLSITDIRETIMGYGLLWLDFPHWFQAFVRLRQAKR